MQHLFYDITFTPDPEVVAYVGKRRNDPDILQTVESDAFDPDVWWQWFDVLPVDHPKYLSQKGVLDWLENYMTLSDEVKGYLNYNLMYISQDVLDGYLNPNASPSPVYDMPEFRYD